MSRVDVAGTPNHRFRVLAKSPYGDLALWVQGGASSSTSTFRHRVRVIRYGQPLAGVTVAITIPVPPWDTLARDVTDAQGSAVLEFPCASAATTYNLSFRGSTPFEQITLQSMSGRCGVPLQTLLDADW
jgi:hypothetical protein